MRALFYTALALVALVSTTNAIDLDAMPANGGTPTGSADAQRMVMRQRKTGGKDKAINDATSNLVAAGTNQGNAANVQRQKRQQERRAADAQARRDAETHLDEEGIRKVKENLKHTTTRNRAAHQSTELEDAVVGHQLKQLRQD